MSSGYVITLFALLAKHSLRGFAQHEIRRLQHDFMLRVAQQIKDMSAHPRRLAVAE